MWNINSEDVQQAKTRLDLRRAEIDARYAEEKSALDAEFAVLETLDRVASDFAQKHGREQAGPAEVPPQMPAAEDSTAAEPPPEVQAQDEADTGLDILKPGSRWRFHRNPRSSEPENPTGETASTPW
jgi:hypothetical protein